MLLDFLKKKSAGFLSNFRGMTMRNGTRPGFLLSFEKLHPMVPKNIRYGCQKSLSNIFCSIPNLSWKLKKNSVRHLMKIFIHTYGVQFLGNFGKWGSRNDFSPIYVCLLRERQVLPTIDILSKDPSPVLWSSLPRPRSHISQEEHPTSLKLLQKRAQCRKTDSFHVSCTAQFPYYSWNVLM